MNKWLHGSSAMWLVIYGVMIWLASLAGGWIPLVVRLTHRRVQVAISFVAGLMLGMAILHLLPHAWYQLQSIDRVANWFLGGFLIMFFLQRFFHFHHHDVPDATVAEPHGHEGCDHDHDDHGDTLVEHSAGRLSWAGALLGLGVHTLIDGTALAASVAAENHESNRAWAGFGTFLVILLHKPFDAMAIGTLMAADRRSKNLRHAVNGLFALLIPLGIILFQIGVKELAGGATGQFVGSALAFSAGTFLCISASDLLPELQFHSHDRFQLSIALALGLGLSILIGQWESGGHETLPLHSEAQRPPIDLQPGR